MKSFELLKNTFTSSIFPWSYFVDFEKAYNNTFMLKVQLNILNSLLGEKNIEGKFLAIIKQYPETRKILPILLAVRNFDKQILNTETLQMREVYHLFDPLVPFLDNEMLEFFQESGLKYIFQNKHISNLNDYVFGVEVGLDSNARKNRTGGIMENLVEKIISDFCRNNPQFQYKNQANVSYIKQKWGIDVKTDKLSRRFDFAVFDSNKRRLSLFEVNYYGGGGSKLKAVAGEFVGLYQFIKNQGFEFYWITDGLGWLTALNPLEDAYNAMDGNIYNLEMLKNNILGKILLDD